MRARFGSGRKAGFPRKPPGLPAAPGASPSHWRDSKGPPRSARLLGLPHGVSFTGCAFQGLPLSVRLSAFTSQRLPLRAPLSGLPSQGLPPRANGRPGGRTPLRNRAGGAQGSPTRDPRGSRQSSQPKPRQGNQQGPRQGSQRGVQPGIRWAPNLAAGASTVESIRAARSATRPSNPASPARRLAQAWPRSGPQSGPAMLRTRAPNRTRAGPRFRAPRTDGARQAKVLRPPTGRLWF